MQPRLLSSYNHSFFLFGPRGTGKTYWLKDQFQGSLYIDLLKSDLYFRYLTNPHLFRDDVLAYDPKDPVVVDEIQKLPILLDEIHHLIESYQYKFILTGSSARKLKKSGANLLAGRALVLNLYPYVYLEWKEFLTLDRVLQFGSLPIIQSAKGFETKALESYVGTYLKEEIKEESLVRNLHAFARFLEIAALLNSEILNLSNISRDTGVPRQVVSEFFEILTDTLIGAILPPWAPNLRVKETRHPKFYFFDCGVVRVLQNRHREPLSSLEKGKLLESYFFHELRSYSEYKDRGAKFYYWRTNEGLEVDFICVFGSKKIAIEVKSSKIWKNDEAKGLLALHQSKEKFEGIFGIYLGEKIVKKEFGEVYPLFTFLEKLYQGKII